MSATLREQMEQAAIHELRARLPYLACVEPYNGELEAAQEEALREALVGRTPGVFVFTGPGRYNAENLQRRKYTKSVTLSLIACSSNFRSKVTQLHGEQSDRIGNDPGIYRILEDAFGRLAGWDLDLDGVGTLQALAEEPILQRDDLCVWRKNFEADVDAESIDRDAEAAMDLETLSGRVSQPEDEALIAEGTGDSFAVSGSTVTLTDGGAAFVAAMVGLRIRIEGSLNILDDGTFDVTAVPSGTTIRWSNPSATAGAFSGTWKVLDKAAALIDVGVE